MADNYLATRRESDRRNAAAIEEAIKEVSEGLRGDLGRMTLTYSGLSRQISEQKQQIATLQDSLEVAHTNSTLQTKQLEWITSDVNTLRVWVKFGTVIIVLLLVALVALTVLILRGR